MEDETIDFPLSTSFLIKRRLSQQNPTVLQTATYPNSILVEGIAVSLDLVHGTEPLRQLRWELVVELAPVLVADLCLEAMKDLEVTESLVKWNEVTRSSPYILEHFVKIGFRVAPRRCSIAEEDEVRNNASRVNGDHLTHSTKSGVLLLVIADVPQRRAPVQTR